MTNEMCKRPLQDSGASVNKRQRTSSVTDIGDLKFLFFTAASCGGLCQGCDLCHPEVCAPKEANAIEKDGIIYKRIGSGFKRAFASLTCLFIRVRGNFRYYTTPTAKPNHQGRLIVVITDDNGLKMGSQALKFASLAWGQVTPAAKLGTADMPLRGFKRAFPVDHIDGNPSNNNVSNAMIMTKAEHKEKTRLSEAQIANHAMSLSAPCTMTVFDLEGNPLLDSESKPIVENEPHRKKLMNEYKLKSYQIADSIKRKDMPNRNSLVKINYNGQDCLAQFSWYDLPDLEGEIWKKLKKADHKTLELPIPPLTEYYVSNMARFKSVTKSTQNAKIRDFRGQVRPSIQLMKKNLYFHRAVALVFHREQMNEYILEQKAKTGIVWTFATLEVDHIDFNPKNHRANNLQFLTHQENTERSNNRPCIIWEIGKEDAQTEYRSLTAAAKEIGCSETTVHDILKNNTRTKWCGEYM
jgi:hypothetical protein